MAPKKPKKPSYLQRQRQLRAQQQQVREASSNKLPPGKKGGDVTKAKPAKPTAKSKPAPVQRVRVRDLGTTKPNQMSGNTPRALPPGRTGGALARTARGAAAAATKGGPNLLGRATLPLAIGNQVSDVARVARQNQRWDEYKRANGLDKQSQPTSSKTRRGQGSGNKPRSNDMKPKANWRDKVSSSDVDTLRKGQNETIRSYADEKPASPSTTATSKSPTSRRSSSSSSSTRSQTPPKSRFTGTVDEGRKMWAEKYSSSKYDGQAIQKEAKKLLEKMKQRKQDKSNAQRAGWDGNKNY